MIVDALIAVAALILSPLTALLPQVDPGDGSLLSLFEAGKTIGALDHLVPIMGPLRLISTAVYALPALIAVAIGVWAYKLLPGKAA